MAIVVTGDWARDPTTVEPVTPVSVTATATPMFSRSSSRTPTVTAVNPLSVNVVARPLFSRSSSRIPRITGGGGSGYSPPTPSATFNPRGRVGVQPFINAGLALQTHTGNITASTPGQVIQGLDIFGYVNVTAANVTVKQCRIRGDAAQTTNYGLVSANVIGSSVSIFDCDLVPDATSVWVDGFSGANVVAWRNYVYRCVDGSGCLYGSSSHYSDALTWEAQGNDYFDTYFTSPDPINHPSDKPISATHNDCGVQIQTAGGASSVKFWYNSSTGQQVKAGDILLDAAHANAQGGYNGHYPYTTSNSSVQITAKLSNINNVSIRQNWLGGGAECVNVGAPATGFSYSGCEIVGNIFTRDQRPDTDIAIGAPLAGWTVTGNTYTDGTAAKLYRF